MGVSRGAGRHDFRFSSNPPPPAFSPRCVPVLPTHTHAVTDTQDGSGGARAELVHAQAHRERVVWGALGRIRERAGQTASRPTPLHTHTHGHRKGDAYTHTNTQTLLYKAGMRRRCCLRATDTKQERGGRGAVDTRHGKRLWTLVNGGG